MVERVEKEISMCGWFVDDIDFALSRIQRLMDWVHFSWEMGFISFEEWKDLIDYANSIKLKLKKRKGVRNETERDCKASEL